MTEVKSSETEKDTLGFDLESKDKNDLKDKSDEDNQNNENEDDNHNYEDSSYDPVEKHSGDSAATLEENEEEIASMYHITSKEWKDRGTGNMRFLKHKKTGKVRLIMRRKRIGKLCSNHYITPEMNLKPHSGSSKSFIWTTLADMSDGTPNQEMLAIRFSKVEEAELFKNKFEEVQAELKKSSKNEIS